jgi:hypothetical protein
VDPQAIKPSKERDPADFSTERESLEDQAVDFDHGSSHTITDVTEVKRAVVLLANKTISATGPKKVDGRKERLLMQ